MKLLRELLFPLIAVVAAFVVGGILILIIGDNPIETYRLLVRQRVVLARRHRLYAFLRDAVDLHRPGGVGGLSLRPAEHRR